MKGGGLLFFLLGYRCIRVSREESIDVLNLCFAHGIQYRGFEVDEDGRIQFVCDLLSAKKLKKRCREKGIAIEQAGITGLPWLLYRLAHRPGMILGTLLCILLLIASTRFVWDIRITGNETMSREEVLEELKQEGFFVGTYIPSVEENTLSNRILLHSKRIAWISVYMRGTVGVVQIVEYDAPPTEEESNKPANLIAKYDGQIEYVELYRGNCIVRTGQAVRKGELLVSGLYDSPGTGFAWTRANGHVFARTEHELLIQIPLSYEEKVYQEEESGGFLLSFFDFSLNFSKKCGNEGCECDIIEKEKCFSFFGEHPLPLSVTYYTHKPYTTVFKTRSYQEALAVAYRDLDTQLSALSGSAELIEKRIVCTLEGDTLTLVCTVKCIEDIAVQSEFEIHEIP